MRSQESKKGRGLNTTDLEVHYILELLEVEKN